MYSCPFVVNFALIRFGLFSFGNLCQSFCLILYYYENYLTHFSCCVNFIQGKHGRAFLFAHAMNIVLGPKEERLLITGLHKVADVYCSDCRLLLGWKYERAYEESQKYKEGKYILEKPNIVKENW